MLYTSRNIFYLFKCSCLLFSLVVSVELIAQVPKKKNTKNGVQEKQNFEDKIQVAANFFADGVKAFSLETYPEAITLFQKAVELAPNHAGFQYKLAETYLRMRNWQSALNTGKQAITLEKNNKYYYVIVAKAYIAQEKYTEGIEVYQNLIKNCPNAEEYYFEIAQMQVKIGKLEDALISFDKIEQRYGINESIIKEKQQIYLSLKKPKKAIAEAERLREQSPFEPRYTVNLALMFLENKQSDKALETLKNIIQKGYADAPTHITLAEIYRQQEQYKNAIDELQIALQMPDLEVDNKINILLNFMQDSKISNNPDIQKSIVKILQNVTQMHPQSAKPFTLLADMLLLQNNKKEANANYYKTLSLDENNPDVWFRLLQLDEELALTDSTYKHAEKAVTLFPNNAVFWLYYGVSCYQKKEYQKAAEALEEGKRLAFNNQDLTKEFLIRLGDTYNALKSYPESDKNYEDALKINPNEVYVLNNYSYYLALRKDKLERANELATQLIKQAPDNPNYIDTYAWVMYANRQYAKAKNMIEKIINKTQSGEVIEHYGDILFQLGETEKALEQWLKAKKMGRTTLLIDKKIADKKLYE